MADPIVAALAAAQLGVFARFQLLDKGVDASLVKRRVRSGAWVRLAPGVYGLPGFPDSWARRLWVTYLAAGSDSVVSHESAAADHAVPGFPRDLLTVTVPHPQHQRVAGATVHQSRVMHRHHWVNLYGRRTTTLARTLVDLAAGTSYARLDAAYEYALTTDHLTHARMVSCFVELFHPARRGMTKLGTILDERGPGHVPAASELERMLFAACDLVGLTPVRQSPLPGDQVISGCVDAAFIDAKLILEADGRRWHTRAADFRRDRERDKAAARAGWQTMRFCHEELVEDLRGQAATMREVYDQRRRLLDSAV
jgi:very-short-patch-repair endonuclease